MNTVNDISEILKSKYVEYLYYYEPIERRLLNYGYVVNANMMMYYKDRIMADFEEVHHIPLKYFRVGDLRYLVLGSDEIIQELEKCKKVKKINLSLCNAIILVLIFCGIFIDIINSKIGLSLLGISLTLIFVFLYNLKNEDPSYIIDKLCEEAVIELNKYDKQHVDGILYNSIHGHKLSESDIIKIKKFYDFEEVKQKLHLN